VYFSIDGSRQIYRQTDRHARASQYVVPLLHGVEVELRSVSKPEVCICVCVGVACLYDSKETQLDVFTDWQSMAWSMGHMASGSGHLQNGRMTGRAW